MPSLLPQHNMEQAWVAALTSATTSLDTADDVTPLDLNGAVVPNMEHLRAVLMQRRSVLADYGSGGVGLLKRWLFPVRFANHAVESRFQEWENISMLTSRKVCHTLLFFMPFAVTLTQYAGRPADPVFVVLHSIMWFMWLTASFLIWRKPGGTYPVTAIATCHTLMGAIVFFSTMICTDKVESAQCASLQKGLFNGAHFLAFFAYLIVHSASLQVPCFIGHMLLLLICWQAPFLSLFPVGAYNQVLIPVSMVIFVYVQATQVYAAQVTSRLQFSLTVELLGQLHTNRKAMHALDQAHRDAVAARVKADRADTIKSINESIMGYICHQLRNPLHSLQAGLAQLKAQLVARDLDSTTQSAMIIEDSTAHIARVVNNVGDFQQLQAGEVAVALETVNVRQFLEEQIASMASSTPMIAHHIESSVPATIYTDKAKLARLLQIGVQNACKYRRPASLIRIQCMPCSTGQGVRFEVQNEGEGLGTLDVPHAFDPYLLSDNSAVLRIRGLGLGLPLARLIANVLRGRVGLEDKGKLTVFWFAVPLTYTSASLSTDLDDVTRSGVPGSFMLTPTPIELSADRPWSYWGKRVLPSNRVIHSLVVDDLRSNRLMLSAMLKRLGHVVTELADGDEIPELLHAGDPVDLCMLDIHMVRSDGRDIARFLRDQHHEFLVIAVTGNSSAADISSYAAAGFDGVLGKPFTPAHLQALLDSTRMPSSTSFPQMVV